MKPFSNLKHSSVAYFDQTYGETILTSKNADMASLLPAAETLLREATRHAKDNLKHGSADPATFDAVGSEEAWKKVWRFSFSPVIASWKHLTSQ